MPPFPPRGVPSLALLAALLLSTALPVALPTATSLCAQDAQQAEGATDMPAPEPTRRTVRRGVPGRTPSREPREPSEIADQPDGSSSRITAGWIPVLNLLRFLEAETGMPVLHPSSTGDPTFSDDAMIHMLGDHTLTVERAIGILDTNGYEVVENRLPDGTDVLYASCRLSRSAMAPVLPYEERIYGPGVPLPDGPPHRLAMRVFQLEHADANTVTQLLRVTLGLAGPEGTFTRLVPDPSSRRIVVTATLAKLRLLHRLLALLDVPSPEPAPEPVGPDRRPDEQGER